MWEAILKSGCVVKEGERQWRDVQDNVMSLSICHNGVRLSLPENQLDYSQAKTASAPITGGDAEVESRWIACTTELGQIIRIRCHKSGDVDVEIE